MKKPALQWFEQLPEPIRSQAIANSYGLSTQYANIGECLYLNFEGAKTSQGYEYWDTIRTRARNGEFDQPNLHGWIPVGERLPTDEDGDENGDVLTLNFNNKKQIFNWVAVRPAVIQFWQPLPKLPEVKS